MSAEQFGGIGSLKSQEKPQAAMSVQAYIAESFIGSGLTSDEVALLCEGASVKFYPSGATITEYGEEGSSLIILARGLASAKLAVEEPIAMIRPGMPLGELSLIDELPRSATVEAVEDCEVVVLDADRTKRIISEDTRLAVKVLTNLAKVLCHRLRTTNRLLASVIAVEEVERLRK